MRQSQRKLLLLEKTLKFSLQPDSLVSFKFYQINAEQIGLQVGREKNHQPSQQQKDWLQPNTNSKILMENDINMLQLIKPSIQRVLREIIIENPAYIRMPTDLWKQSESIKLIKLDLNKVIMRMQQIQTLLSSDYCAKLQFLKLSVLKFWQHQDQDQLISSNAFSPYFFIKKFQSPCLKILVLEGVILRIRDFKDILNSNFIETLEEFTIQNCQVQRDHVFIQPHVDRGFRAKNLTKLVFDNIESIEKLRLAIDDFLKQIRETGNLKSLTIKNCLLIELNNISYLNLEHLELSFISYELKKNQKKIQLNNFQNLESLSLSKKKLSVDNLEAGKLQKLKLIGLKIHSAQKLIQYLDHPFFANIESLKLSFSTKKFSQSFENQQRHQVLFPQLKELDLTMPEYCSLNEECLFRFLNSMWSSQRIEKLYIAQNRPDHELPEIQLSSQNDLLGKHSLQLFTNVQMLKISCIRFSILKQLFKENNFKYLEFVNLEDSNVNDRFLSSFLHQIESPFLKNLNLKQNVLLSGEGVFEPELIKFSSLEILDLSMTNFQLQYLQRMFLCQFGSNLKQLYLGDCGDVSIEEPIFSYKYQYEMRLETFQIQTEYASKEKAEPNIISDMLSQKCFTKLEKVYLKLDHNWRQESLLNLVAFCLENKNLKLLQVQSSHPKNPDKLEILVKKIIELQTIKSQMMFRLHFFKAQMSQFLKIFRIEIFYEILTEFLFKA